MTLKIFAGCVVGFLTAILAVCDPVTSNLALADDSEERLSENRSRPFRDVVKQYLGKGLGQRKIIGGEEAHFSDHPWQVALLVSWIADPTQAQFCGGSIVDKNWILTAAHCVHGNQAEDMNVLVGTAKLGVGGARYNVEHVFMHPDYDNDSFNNDIALIKTKGDLSSGTKVTLVDESREAEISAPGKTVRVSGWGVTDSGNSSSILKQVEVPVVSIEQCNDPVSYDGKITDMMLCAGFATGEKDSCQGDSGGPLTAPSSSGERYLVGVVSWGEGCAEPAKYGVYARVSKLRSWTTSCMSDQGNC